MVHSTATAGSAQPSVALTVPSGFTLTTIATVAKARQLAALPNGDLLVATNGTAIYLVPNADATSAPGAPVAFTTPGETPAQGIAFDASSCAIYLSSQHNVYEMAYADAQQSAAAVRRSLTCAKAAFRRIGRQVTRTTTPRPRSASQRRPLRGRRFVVQRLRRDRSDARIDTANGPERCQHDHARDTHPKRHRTGTQPRHGNALGRWRWPRRFARRSSLRVFDAVTLHTGVADYGWPSCEENNVAYTTGADCAATVAPLIELPAYSTIIGAAFYPSGSGRSARFPAAYEGGLFLTAHGSWHTNPDGTYVSSPQVVYVPMNGDAPQTAVDWSDPTKQWTPFVGGFQLSDGKTRVARPTGIAVGALGSLFIADDQNGYVFRVRPN